MSRDEALLMTLYVTLTLMFSGYFAIEFLF